MLTALVILIVALVVLEHAMWMANGGLNNSEDEGEPPWP